MKFTTLLILGACSLAAVNADTISYWRFENGAANTAAVSLADSSTNSNPGTPSGGPIHRALTPEGFPADDNTLSLEFDGINDIVEIPASTSLDFSGSFTVEFWMRSPGTGGGQDLIIDKSHGTDGITGWFFQSRPNVGNIDFGMGNGSGFPLVTSSASLFDDEWHHLAGTYDGNIIEFFVDGVSQGTTVAGTYSDNTNPVRMGNTQSIARYFKGQLDEVRISTAVLKPCEFLLSTLEGSQAGIPEPETVTIDGIDRFGLRYRRLSGGTTDGDNIYTSGSYIYIVEVSSGLNGFASGAADLAFTDLIDNGDGTETVTAYLTTPFPANSGKLFMRLRVRTECDD